MISIVVLFLLLLLSVTYDINGQVKNKDSWYNVMLVIFILIAGLRWRLGLDTPNYIEKYYYSVPNLNNFRFVDYWGASPLWTLMNSLLKTMGCRFYVLQLLHASIVNILIFKYIKKHSSYIFTSIFFYAISCYLTFNMEIMRGVLSIVVCLFANDYIIEKRWIKGYVLYFVAFLFHIQTIVLFMVPLLFYLRFNRKGIAILICAYLFGFFIQEYLGDYIELLNLADADSRISNKAMAYAENEKYMEGSGYLRAIVNLFLLLTAIWYLKRHNNVEVLKLEPVIMAGLVFNVLMINVFVAYRYTDYFKIPYAIFYSELFVCLIKDVKILKRSVSCVRTILLYLPLFYVLGRAILKNIYRYYPYSSVIELSVDRNRESNYMKSERPIADFNMY